MLFATHGTTDMPMRDAFFTTSGVENFLKDVMRTDTQDFLGKMEGFAVQDIQGIISFFVNPTLPDILLQEQHKITSNEFQQCVQISIILSLRTSVGS